MNTQTLIITEKPSVARAIAAALGANVRGDGCIHGNNLIVSWCYGHLVELAVPAAYDEKFGKWRREDLPILPEQWKTTVMRDKRQQFEILRGLMQRTDVGEVVNACDAGREGELIFRLVYEKAGCTKSVKRLWLSSMEPDEIRKAYANMRPGAEYDNLYAAALCRAKADWLVGMNATRLMSLVYHRTLNVGRVVLSESARSRNSNPKLSTPSLLTAAVFFCPVSASRTSPKPRRSQMIALARRI